VDKSKVYVGLVLYQFDFKFFRDLQQHFCQSPCVFYYLTPHSLFRAQQVLSTTSG